MALTLATAGALALPPAKAEPTASSGGRGAPVVVYLTSGKRHLARQPDRHFSAPARPRTSAVTITVDPARRAQGIRGFGAALTDTSLWLLSRLPRPERMAVLRRLFDPVDGIGLSVVRVPIAASDFIVAPHPYSYDDLPAGHADPRLKRFSIAHDRAYVLPVLREALRVNPRLKIIATPWSPPAWMKSNDSLFAVSVPGGPGTLLPQYYGTLARYFVRFLAAYRRAGVPVWAITPQNEPLQATTDYSGMLLTASQERTFVVDDLVPALRRARLHPRIYGYDYVWLGAEGYVPTLLSGSGGRDFAGAAYHCYFGSPDSMGTLHAEFPSFDTIESECSTGISVLSPIQVLVRSVANWASTVLMWNVALDPAGGPKIGTGCETCIGFVTVDPGSEKVSYTGDYFQFGQASNFVSRGARRLLIQVTPAQPSCGGQPACGLEEAAFRDPNGRKVLVVTNSSAQSITFSVRRPNGTSFSYSLPGQHSPNGTDNSRDASVVTFIWR